MRLLAGLLVVCGAVLAIVYLSKRSSEDLKVPPESTQQVPVASTPSSVSTQPSAQPAPLPASSPAALADSKAEKERALPPETRKAVSESIEAMLNLPTTNKNSVQAWHQAYAAQPLDPSWSSNVEPQLQAHLSVPNQQTPKSFEVLSMECRKSICEIRATALSKELNSQGLDDFQNRVFSMPKEPWWSSYGIVEPMLDASVARDGTLMLVAYVSTQSLTPQ